MAVYINYFWKVLHFLTKMIVPLFFNFWGAKILSPVEFGNIVYLLTSLSIISIFSNFGISGSAMKIASEKFHNNDILGISSIFSSSGIISISIIPIILIVYFILMWQHVNLLVLSIPFIFFSPLTSILDGIYSGILKFKQLAVLTVIPSVIALASSFFLIKIYGAKGILMSYSLFYSLLFIFYFTWYPYKNFIFNKEITIKVFNYAVILGVGSLAFFLYSRVDILILQHYNFTKEVGYYEVIIRVFEVITVPLFILGQVLAPYFIGFKIRKEKAKLVQYSIFIPLIILVLGTVIALIGNTSIPFLTKRYFPEYYTDEFQSILFILLMTLPLKVVGVFMSNGILSPLGYAKITSYVTLVFGVLNVIADVLFIEQFGFVGVFWATFFIHNTAIIIQLIFFYYKLKKDYVVVRL